MATWLPLRVLTPPSLAGKPASSKRCNKSGISFATAAASMDRKRRACLCSKHTSRPTTAEWASKTSATFLVQAAHPMPSTDNTTHVCASTKLDTEPLVLWTQHEVSSGNNVSTAASSVHGAMYTHWKGLSYAVYQTAACMQTVTAHNAGRRGPRTVLKPAQPKFNAFRSNWRAQQLDESKPMTDHHAILCAPSMSQRSVSW
mmetsp:Transcript_60101/g.166357  ORF Transcript_60101/g.166357 Transcript_60101/m.166357 type:complete len:201 (+) Transcript_60101:178-780(+)